MRIEIGFPSREMEKEILEKDPADQLLGALEEVITKEEVVDMQKELEKSLCTTTFWKQCKTSLSAVVS